MAKPNEPKPKLKAQSLVAYPDEIKRWKAKAEADNRRLGSWLRLRVLEGEKQQESKT
jgi:hypothetical protein